MTIKLPCFICLLALFLAQTAGRADDAEPRPTKLPPGVTPIRFIPPCPKVAYPSAAKARGEQGVTAIWFRVGPDGLDRSEIAESSGSADLDQASLDQLKQCHIAPAQQDGKPWPEPVWARIRYTWKLEDQNEK